MSINYDIHLQPTQVFFQPWPVEIRLRQVAPGNPAGAACTGVVLLDVLMVMCPVEKTGALQWGQVFTWLRKKIAMKKQWINSDFIGL